MGKLMGTNLMQSEGYGNIDALIPLPLFRAREKRRGYNQACVLCEGMSSVMNIPVLKDVVTRISSSESQTHKNRIDRWKNMEGRFELTGRNSIVNKHVVLVDDVITTGATLEACGLELLQSENVQLSIVTMAFAMK